MSKKIDFSKVVERIKANYGDQPLIQQLVDYFQHDGPMPNIRPSNYYDRWVLAGFNEFAADFPDKFIAIYFKDGLRSGLIEAFFDSDHFFDFNLNVLYEKAYYKFLEDEEDPNAFYANLFAHSWDSEHLTVKSDCASKILLEAKDLRPFGKFLIGLEDKEAIYFLHALLINDENNRPYGQRLTRNLTFFHQYFPVLVRENFDKITTLKVGFKKGLKTENVKRLLDISPEKYEPMVRVNLDKISYQFEASSGEYEVISRLYKNNQKEYKEIFLKFIHHFLDCFTVPIKYPYGGDGSKNKQKAMKSEPMTARNTPRLRMDEYYWISLIKYVFESLKEIDVKVFEERLVEFCKKTVFMPIELLEIIESYFGDKRMAVLAPVFELKNVDDDNKFVETIMQSVAGVDWSGDVEAIWEFNRRIDRPSYQIPAAKVFATKPKVIKPLIEKGLTKTKGDRLLAFFTLAQMDSKYAKDLLWKQFHEEKDDKIREVILPIITRKFYNKDFSRKEVDAIINSAVARGATQKV